MLKIFLLVFLSEGFNLSSLNWVGELNPSVQAAIVSAIASVVTAVATLLITQFYASKNLRKSLDSQQNQFTNAQEAQKDQFNAAQESQRSQFLDAQEAQDKRLQFEINYEERLRVSLEIIDALQCMYDIYYDGSVTADKLSVIESSAKIVSMGVTKSKLVFNVIDIDKELVAIEDIAQDAKKVRSVMFPDNFESKSESWDAFRGRQVCEIGNVIDMFLNSINKVLRGES